MLIPHSDVIVNIPFGHDRWFTSNSARFLQIMRYWEALGKFSEITSYTKTKSSLYQPITRKTENRFLSSGFIFSKNIPPNRSINQRQEYTISRKWFYVNKSKLKRFVSRTKDKLAYFCKNITHFLYKFIFTKILINWQWNAFILLFY